MFHLIGKTNIDFIGKRKYAFAISGVLIAIGLIALVMIMIGKANMGIDFAGGTMIQGSFAQPIDIGDLRGALSNGGFPDATIQELKAEGMQNYFLIRVKNLGENTPSSATETINSLMGLISTSFPNNHFTKDSEHSIGPAVGETLRSQAKWAVILAVLGILIYIWFRFDFRFGVAATIATFHDVLAVLGIFWLLGIEIDLLVITALLTLAGYSLTDTVVVFDRIRENLKLFRKKGDFVSTINISINEVLSRTVITALTVFLVVMTLLLFGGQVLFSFALALSMGVIIGTYSSVFVASPIVVEWEARSPKRFK
ncbi:MAG: protein translocase subunit SecF [candidate division Zixibacteria bacterium]|nr:protein translocase subunit SecF [candidate division Zixibacteria bacterium]